MNMIYNSEQYSVVEFGVDRELEALRFGGFEIVDKAGRREAFIGGRALRQQPDRQRTDDVRKRRLPGLVRHPHEPAGGPALSLKRHCLDRQWRCLVRFGMVSCAPCASYSE